MNRRICAFEHDGKYYISQEFNGDGAEASAWQSNIRIPFHWSDVIGTFNGSETLDDFISAVHSMENAYGYEHEDLEVANELPSVQEVWLLKEGQLQLYAKYGELVSSIEAKKSLAERLNDFYKDFDYYDYMDKLNGTEEDTIEGLVGQLGDPTAVKGIIDVLADIKENGQLSDAERLELDDLISNLSKVLDSLISVKSFDTILRAAQEKSSLADNNNAVVCKENCDYGK